MHIRTNSSINYSFSIVNRKIVPVPFRRMNFLFFIFQRFRTLFIQQVVQVGLLNNVDRTSSTSNAWALEPIFFPYVDITHSSYDEPTMTEAQISNPGEVQG